jgi:gliding motility-associated-like protein
LVNSPVLALPEGNNQIRVIDSEGCDVTRDIEVELPNKVNVFLPADTTIRLGQTLSLNAQTNLSLWDTIIWTPLVDTLNKNTLSQSWQPLFSQPYRIQIVDTAGCIGSATIRVIVREPEDIYVPNVFQPGTDGGNELWRMFTGPSVELLESAHVFDRWGNAVYRWEDALPANQWPGWDGRFRSRAVNPGVYVYYIWVRLVNGERILISGDLTVLR